MEWLKNSKVNVVAWPSRKTFLFFPNRVPPDRTLEGEDSDMKEKLALESEFKKAALPTETSQPPYVA